MKVSCVSGIQYGFCNWSRIPIALPFSIHLNDSCLLTEEIKYWCIYLYFFLSSFLLQLATVERLLTLNPTLANCHDSDGYTPLHRAAYGGHYSMVSALLNAGANLHARTTDDWIPLHSACRWGHAAVASCLLQWGAEVNALTTGRLTPLQLAAGNAAAGKTIELLLSQRTLQAGLKNSAGETAYDIAHRTSEHHRLFEMAEPCNNIYWHVCKCLISDIKLRNVFCCELKLRWCYMIIFYGK